MNTSLKYIYLSIRKRALSPFLLLRREKKPPLGGIKKILCLRHDRIGDMVLSTPVFIALKTKWPKSIITVLASEKNKDVIANNPYVDEILIYKGIVSFAKQTRKKRFDLAIDLFLTHELTQALLTMISAAPYRLGFAVAGREAFLNMQGPAPGTTNSMTARLFELIECAGVEKIGFEPELYLSSEEITWARNFFHSHSSRADALIIAMHPGGYYPSQRWPAQCFSELGKKICEKYPATILILGDKKEELLIKEAAEKIPANDVIACDTLGLRKTISLLSQARLFIGNNSGLLHIASALKIPTLSTLGPTDPHLWWPQGKKDIVICKNLPCSPCSKAACASHNCLASITVEEMMQAVDTQLNGICA